MRLESIKYQLTTFIRYLGDAFIYPFLALYLKQIGLVNRDIGLIMMILPLVAIFINPLWASFSKNINSNKIFASVLTIIEGVAVIILVNVGTNLWLIALIVFIIGVAGQPFYILYDSFTVIYTKIENYNYSKIRIFGTLAYMISVSISGIIAFTNYKLAFYIGSVAFIITSFLLAWIRPLDINKDQFLTKRANPRKLFKNKNYWIYVIFLTLTFATMSTFDTYLPTYLYDNHNINNMYYGFIVSAFVLFELIILFFLNRYGHKIKHIYLHIAIILSLVIRYGAYTLDGFISLPLWLILAVTMLRSVPISVVLYVMMKMISYLVEPYNVTLATLIFGSIRAAYTAVLVLAGGYLTTNPNNYKYWFLIGAVISLLAFGFINYKIGAKTEEDMINYNKVSE